MRLSYHLGFVLQFLSHLETVINYIIREATTLTISDGKVHGLLYYRTIAIQLFVKHLLGKGEQVGYGISGEMAYVSINFIVGEIRLDVRVVVTHACFRNHVVLGCFGLCSGSRVLRGLASLGIVLSILLRAESETPAASWSRFIGACL